MENTTQNRYKFYAQYYGQEVARYKVGMLSDVSAPMVMIEWLELKPLSSITDEDAIEVLKILGEYQPKPILITKHEDRGRYWTRISKPYNNAWGEEETNVLFNVSKKGVITNHRNSSGEDYLQAYDYLRSKGYALPFNGLSVEKQIECGLIKLIN